MMKRIITFVLIAILAISVNAQGISEESVTAELQSAHSLILEKKYPEALRILLKYKKAFEIAGMCDTDAYYTLISTISSVYMAQGSLKEAQDFMMEESKKLSETENLTARYPLQNYALIFYELKDYKTSLQLAMEAKNLYELAKDTGSMPYARLLNFISVCRMASEDLLMAKLYMDTYQEIVDGLGSNVDRLTPEYLLGINNAASLQMKMGQYDKALEAYQDIVSLTESDPLQVENHILAMLNIGFVYFMQERYELARDIYDKLENIASANFSVNSYVAENSLYTDLRLGSDKIQSRQRHYNQMMKEHLYQTFGDFSESEREKFWNVESRRLLSANNQVALLHYRDQDIVNESLNMVIFTKNMLLDSQRSFESMASNCKNAEVQSTYREYHSLKDSISRTDRLHTPISDIRQMNNRLLNLDRKLTLLMPEYRQAIMQHETSWEKVQGMLKPGELLIEFSILPYQPDIKDKASLYYGAYLIMDSGSPKLVPLCSHDELQKLLDLSARFKRPQEYYSMVYGSDTKSVNPLYQLIWEGISEYCEGISRIYYSPSGLINKFNLGCIPDADGQMLDDKYDMIELSSSNLIGDTRKKGKAKYSNAVVYGGIRFNVDREEDLRQAAMSYKSSDSDELVAFRTGEDRGRLAYLHGSRVEAEMITRNLSKEGIHAQMLTELEANEESFKALSGNSPEIIHLSTHGFFLLEGKDRQDNFFEQHVGGITQEDQYMSYTGLIFAGGNKAWLTGSGFEGIEDGILTAEEISRLDLGKTKLVVLSACETGLGFNNQVDGIFGLQRGFKKAGVETIIMSLWKVDDTATSELMRLFYEFLMKDGDSRIALKKAKDEMRKSYDSPYYWAGFVIMD